MVTSRTKQLVNHLVHRKVTIAPLVTFRILFGLLMLVSIIRFWANGWIYELYIAPKWFFPFVEGVRPLNGNGMYVVFLMLAISAVAITLGLAYRIASIVFFVLFTYVELLDKTNYLNHYYFVTLMAFLLCWLPAHRDLSIDRKLGWVTGCDQVPIAYVNILRFQIGVVYFFAGIAKVNAHWLLDAQPLRMWLAANSYKPFIGWVFRYKLTAYLCSWFGMLYDLAVPCLLCFPRWRSLAYVLVVTFHLMTWWLFPIGMFPFIMIAMTTLFFDVEWHRRLLEGIKRMLRWNASPVNEPCRLGWKQWVFAACVASQLVIPLRHLLYTGDLFWTEQGYRFSWRVMLTEKAGQATFYVSDKYTQQRSMVANYELLTPQQEKMMATQPDMMVQYAHLLEEMFLAKGMANPVITADVFVTLNGAPHKRLVDPTIDLTEVENDWGTKSWLLPND